LVPVALSADRHQSRRKARRGSMCVAQRSHSPASSRARTSSPSWPCKVRKYLMR